MIFLTKYDIFKKEIILIYLFQKKLYYSVSISPLCQRARGGVEGEEGVSYKLQPYDHLLVHAKL